MHTVSVYLENNQLLVADSVCVADTFTKRFFGLMLKPNLSEGEGLYIKPCQQIHTHFMRFNIDVVFLDANMHVLHIEHNMKPWKISRYYKGSKSVLELSQHLAQSIQLGDRLRLVANTPNGHP